MTKRKKGIIISSIALTLTCYITSWLFAAKLSFVHPMANLMYFHYGSDPKTQTDKLLYVLYYPLYKIEMTKGGSRFGIHWSDRKDPEFPTLKELREMGISDKELKEMGYTEEQLKL